MLRLSTVAVALVMLGVRATAQHSNRILPVSDVRHAGTLHLATETWTRGDKSIALGASDVLYDNTCGGVWFFRLEPDWLFVDDGRLPSTTSPQVDQDALGSGTWLSTSFPGMRDAYEIHGFQFGYCTYTHTPLTAVQLFYDCYDSCSDATTLSPTAAIQISGLPGVPSGAVGHSCWLVNIDLLESTLEFTMSADCDGVWDGRPALDNFGFGLMMPEVDLVWGGPFLAGDPDGLLGFGPGGTGCCVGCNTVFWAGTNVPGTNHSGSGLNAQDSFEIDEHLGGFAFQYNGCFWFGGYSANAPPADLWMRIWGDADGSWPPYTAYCFGSAAQGNPCPCSNDNDQSDPAGAGCANGTFSAGARLRASGVPSVGGDTLVLHGTRGQPGNSSMFFQAENGLDGAGIFLGDGIRCAGGNLKRLKVELNDATGDADTTGTVITIRSAQLGYAIQAGDTLRYQWWYRDAGNPPCGPGVNDSNSSNGLEISWLP